MQNITHVGDITAEEAHRSGRHSTQYGAVAQYNSCRATTIVKSVDLCRPRQPAGMARWMIEHLST